MPFHAAPTPIRPVLGLDAAHARAPGKRYGRNPALAPWQARRVEAFVAANLTEPLRVTDLAAMVGLKARYFTKAFKGSFGDSPHAYVVERRIEQACLLLRDTDEPLVQIALTCGLYDQSHMSRIFRRLRGETPAAWRRARARPSRAAA